ncbi:MAG: zinc-dependent metalloprotease [Mastigocoleus sp.]
MKRFALYLICLQGFFSVVGTAFTNPEAYRAYAVESDRTASKIGKSANGELSQEKEKSSLLNKSNQKSNNQESSKRTLLPVSKVWTIDKNSQVKRQPFMWVVDDVKNKFQQPFLQVENKSSKPNKSKVTPKKDEKKSPENGFESFDKVTKDTEKIPGLFTLYKNKEKNKVYIEIDPAQLNKNFLATATLESGIGEAGIYSGMPLSDFLFYFRRVNKKLHFIVRNVNFRTREGDPQVRSLARSFSDSVLYTIKIKSIHPERKTILVDLGDILLNDLAGLSASLGVSGGGPEQSYFGGAKAFPKNVEVESIMNFVGTPGSAGSRSPKFGTLADNRGFTLRVHYSLSELPNNSYQPRLADERVGYFITAYQNLSNLNRRDPFIRYINRWNLEKQNPKAALSRPKKPIVFWIDNAVPFEYRNAIKEGVLMWNRAFEKAGFKNAIEVRQMPDNATWDPADIRYNTIRWINTVDGYFAMGPSRVNPLTGEILDADILVDASFVRALKNEYRQKVQPVQFSQRTSLTAMMRNRMLCAKNDLTGNNVAENSQNSQNRETNKFAFAKSFISRLSNLAERYDLCYGIEAANQFAYGSLALDLLHNQKSVRDNPKGITQSDGAKAPALSDRIKEYTDQYLRLIIAHEVGHTLGLRHNFRGSTLLTPEQMHDKGITRSRGLTTSVMDYLPPNIAPHGTTQGDYFPSQVGVYDDWAILYGYIPINAASPTAEKSFLAKIANQSYRPELSYATDEDVYDLDPTADAWDNSGDVLGYSQGQLKNARLMWKRLDKFSGLEGETYSDVKDRFGTVLGHYFQHVYYTTKYIGGQSFYRVRPGNSQGKLPFQSIPVEKQRQALETLQKYVFAEDAMEFSPELLNKLAPSRWRHWGSNPQVGRLDYPIHDLVLFMQSLVLRDLLSSDRISRLKDIELKSKTGEALTLPELFDNLHSGIWTEVIKPEKDIKISSLRRGLQRQYVDLLSSMVLRKQYVPEDARTLAWYKLRQLKEKLKDADGKVEDKDQYTKAHLLETRERINKVLDAPLQTN